MSILNFDEGGSSKPSPKFSGKTITRFALLAGSIAVIVGLSSTLAANININSGPIEFGQGVVKTVTCDGDPVDLTLTPTSTFINESGAGDFYMDSITVTGIPDGCNGATFTIKAYEDGSSTPLAPYGNNFNPSDPYVQNGNAFSIYYDGSTSPSAFSNSPMSADYSVSDSTDNSPTTTGSFTIAIGGSRGDNNIQATADRISRITIESGKLDTSGARWSLAWRSDQVFLHDISGITTHSIVRTSLYPAGLIVLEIVPATLDELTLDYIYYGGAFACGLPNNLDDAPGDCHHFQLYDVGFVLTLGENVYDYPQEELLTVG